MNESNLPKINRQWRLQRHPEPGELMNADLVRWAEAPCPEPGPEEVLIKTIALATSPAQFGYTIPGGTMFESLRVGDVMRGRGVGQVMVSNHRDYKVGEIVTASLGWQDYALIRPEHAGQSIATVQKVKHPVAPLTTAVGVLGVDGFTAYFELLEVGQPKAGDTLVVSAGAGGIGSVVGQIGKINGCRVIGITGRDDKCHWLTQELGFDGAINYKTEDVDVRLAELCPKGVDIFFDNVGGDILNTTLAHLALGARVVICGYISTDYALDKGPGPSNYIHLLRQRASMTGTIIFDYVDRFNEAEAQLRDWLARGTLINTEDVDDGLEKMPQALTSLFTGENHGIKIVRVAPDPEGLEAL